METQACALPPQALLGRYCGDGDYTDCFVVEATGPISLTGYVQAFYTSWLFKLERLVLALAARPSSDLQAMNLAAGKGSVFAAWEVEARAVDQLLMRDITGRTRSWFMVEQTADITRLYFGSAVTASRRSAAEHPAIPAGYRALVGLHKLYSRALLACAHRRLQQHAEVVSQ